MDTNAVIAQAVMRNRANAVNKSYSYKYRCTCDKQSIEWENMLIDRANRIISMVELRERLDDITSFDVY